MLTNDQLHALADGELSFGAFAAQAHADMQGLAGRISKRWKLLPTTMDTDDLVQVMLLAVHTNIHRHNPKRGSIRDFIVSRCCYAAKDEINKHAASQRRDDLMHLPSDVQEPNQEAAQLAREMCALLPRDTRQRHIMDALVQTGSMEDAADVLLAHPATFKMFAPQARRPVTSPSDALRHSTRRSVYLTARTWMERAQAYA